MRTCSFLCTPMISCSLLPSHPCSLLCPLPPTFILYPKAGLAWPAFFESISLTVPRLGRASAGLQGSALQWAGRTSRTAVGRRREGEVTLR